MKNRKERRKFTPEFKADAARMVILDGVSVGEAAEKLGVDRSNLVRWKNDYLEQLGAGGDGREHAMTPKEMDVEIRALRKQLRESEVQREILKKALAIFSRESSNGIGS
jgi:transposase-like protein